MGLDLLRSRVLLPLVILASVSSAQTIVYVDAAAAGANDGSSWSDAYVDLQSALARSNAQVWVAKGVYVPGSVETDTFALKSGVALYGGFAGVETSLSQRDWLRNRTVLSGDVNRDDVYGNPWYVGWNITTANSDHVVTANGVDATGVLDGFLVTAGHTGSTGGSGAKVTGGAPIFAHCTFLRNLGAYSGGAVSVFDSDAAFTDCVFLQNWCHLGKGGSIYLGGTSSPTIADCFFRENRCVGGGSSEGAGGAICTYSTGAFTVARCIFDGNFCENFYVQGDPITRGGAILNLFSNLTVDSCRFVSNRAHAGGAIYTFDATNVVNSAFVGNVVTSYQVSGGFSGGDFGGAIAASSFQPDVLSIDDSSFAANSAGEGGALFIAQNHQAVVRNSILWGNIATGSETTTIDRSITGSASVRFSCVEGLLEAIPGEDPPDPADFPGSIDADPSFVSVALGDLHLRPGSLCIDAGNNAYVPAGSTADLDGSARFFDDPAAPDTGSGLPPLADMGAFEAGASALLVASAERVSLSVGGTVTFTIAAGAANASDVYFLMGSATGTSPGFAIGNLTVPLNVDDYLLYTLLHPNAAPLQTSLGLLDASGLANARFRIFAGTAPALTGVTLSHAYVVFDSVGLGATFASNAVPLSLGF